MAEPRTHLNRAPIVEALIDFRVPPAAGIQADSFSNLQHLIGDQYSQSNPIQSIQARFGMDGPNLIQPESRKALHGWIYKAGSDIAQFRIDGFTFSRIEPYTTWEQVFEEAFRLWKVYISLAAPKQVLRLAVRYINRIRVNGPTNLADYLTAPPALAGPIPQRMREFLFRAKVDDTERKASAVIIQALEPQVAPSAISLILDIDAFKDGLTILPDDNSIPNLFLHLRELKNEIFFASITERTAEMYE